MSSAIYLENYLDGLESLPTELERNFKLMRKLDDRAQTAMKSIDSHAKDFMRKLADSGAMGDEERKERLEDIKALFGKAKEYSDDKVQLAIQTYELVDKQIRRLDNDLARFEGEIQEKASSTRAKSEEVVAKKGRKKTKDSKTTGKKKKSASSDEETGRGSNQNNSSVTLNSSSNAGQGTKKKKSKVNQEKDTRKGGVQKVNHHHYHNILPERLFNFSSNYFTAFSLYPRSVMFIFPVIYTPSPFDCAFSIRFTPSFDFHYCTCMLEPSQAYYSCHLCNSSRKPPMWKTPRRNRVTRPPYRAMLWTCLWIPTSPLTASATRCPMAR
ncbi:hypothetical protein KR026_001011 [Drosophila bipectinata]|nr:hypothetical protein KR026_001011 [Drosophila bipectinata]